MEPELIIADEAVSALDVSVQAQILALLRKLQGTYDLGFLFITHDLGVVRNFCDRVLVMYLGHVVEEGPVGKIMDNPRHPYTKSLIASVPLPDPAKKTVIAMLEGEIPSPSNPPSGCPFHPRCDRADNICKREMPRRQISTDRGVACHHPL
nr:ABC transporter ATP-binding protein [Phaeobacter sp. J2-8]